MKKARKNNKGNSNRSNASSNTSGNSGKNKNTNCLLSNRTFSDLPKEIIQHIFNFQAYLEIKIVESYAMGVKKKLGCIKLDGHSKKLILSRFDTSKVANISELIFNQVFGKCKYYQYSSTLYDCNYPITNRLVMLYPNVKVCTVELENCVDDFYFQYFFRKRLVDDLFLRVAFTKLHKVVFSNGYKKEKFCGGSTLCTLRFIRELLMKRLYDPCGREQLISIDMQKIVLRENNLEILLQMWEAFTSHEIVVSESLKEGFLSRFETREYDGGKFLDSRKAVIEDKENVELFTLTQYLEHLQNTIIEIMFKDGDKEVFNAGEKVDTNTFLEKLPEIRQTKFNLFNTMKSNHLAQTFRSLINSLGYFEKRVPNVPQNPLRRERIFQFFSYFNYLKKLTFVVDSPTECLEETMKLIKKYLPNLKHMDIRGGFHSPASLAMLLRDFPSLRSVVIYLTIRAYPKVIPGNDSSGNAYIYSPSVGVGVPYLNDLNSSVKYVRVQPNPSSTLSIAFDRETFLKQIVNKKIQSLKGDFMLAGGAEKLLPISSLGKLVLYKANYNVFERFDFLKVLSQTKSLRVLYIHESLLNWRPKGYKPTVEFFQKESMEYARDLNAWKMKFKIYCKKEKTPLKKLLSECKNITKVKVYYRSIKAFSDSTNTAKEILVELENQMAKMYMEYIGQRFKHLERFSMVPVLE
ncbi:predicted protein [Naegleria gruberi]|uniref:Predicted protein n=1 Tax=Naegleria gruberi TaxID=5762 RepID=D2V225_NAEGR|nr:uncharacterized protein NAEGRDRAFT_46065 [Naegleria gruberi]EFC48979.1 predicted protein [Naegleria gruberi]|eukprot:XP_002681723.1 predicted protein [Naegleria gruberi strain NEG-M]